MKEELLFRLQDRKIRLLEQEAESWQAAHTDAMLAYAAEDVIAACLALPRELEQAWSRWRGFISSGVVVDYQLAGSLVQTLFARVTSLLSHVRYWGRKIAKDTGHDLEGLEELDGALASIQQLASHIFSTWPWANEPRPPLNRVMVEQSRQSHAAGEGEEVTTLISRLEKGEAITAES